MAYYPVIRGPVAPYSNVPIAPQNFAPSQFVITGITYGPLTTVTMANGTNGIAPNYKVGQLVRLLFPSKYGARQLNEQTGYVLIVPTANSVVIGIDSVGADPFIASPTFLPMQSQTPPQIVAVGDINTGPINASGPMYQTTSIPASFINVSP